MTCIKCQYEWCWLCRGKYTSRHFDKFNVFGCPGLKNGENTSKKWSCLKLNILRLFYFFGGIIFAVLFISVGIPLIIVFGLPVLLFRELRNEHDCFDR